MKSWGIEAQRGTPLRQQFLDRFFSNPFYAGILVSPWSGEEYVGRHVPMVSKDEFARVQQITSKRNRKIPHQKVRAEFPLRGQVRCPDCRQLMTASFSRGRVERYGYYHCNRVVCGNRTSFAADHVHDEFQMFLGTIAPRSEILEKFGGFVIDAAEERLALSKAVHVKRRMGLENLERQMRELVAMRTDRLITDEEFLKQKELFSERQYTLQASASLCVSVSDIRGNLNEITEPLTNLQKTWQELQLPFQGRFQRCILPVGYVHGESGTAELAILFRLFSDFANENSPLVAFDAEKWNQIVQEIMEFSALMRAARGAGGDSGRRFHL